MWIFLNFFIFFLFFCILRRVELCRVYPPKIRTNPLYDSSKGGGGRLSHSIFIHIDVGERSVHKKKTSHATTSIPGAWCLVLAFATLCHVLGKHLSNQSPSKMKLLRALLCWIFGNFRELTSMLTMERSPNFHNSIIYFVGTTPNNGRPRSPARAGRQQRGQDIAPQDLDYAPWPRTERIVRCD